jgi:hypothetical protein
VLGEETIGHDGVLAGEAPQHVAREELLDPLVAVGHPQSSR